MAKSPGKLVWMASISLTALFLRKTLTMFTHPLPKDDIPFGCAYSDFAKRNFLKRFAKDNPGRQWLVTEDGIREDLTRISYTDQDLQLTQQVDELWHKDDKWIFKYDFR